MTMFISWIFGAVTLYLKANVFITGLATNLLAGGLTTVLSFQLFGTKGCPSFFQDLPLASRFCACRPFTGSPVSGRSPFRPQCPGLFRLADGRPLLAADIQNPVRFSGFAEPVRNPSAMAALGLEPRRYRMAAILISGFTCGHSGGGS